MSKHELRPWFFEQAQWKVNPFTMIRHISFMYFCRSFRNGHVCLTITKRSIRKHSKRCNSQILLRRGHFLLCGGLSHRVENACLCGDCNKVLPMVGGKPHFQVEVFWESAFGLSERSASGVMGGRGQGFLVCRTGVIGEGNPCPYVCVSFPQKTST